MSLVVNDPKPLAATLRPCCFEEYVGQTHLLSPGLPLYEALQGRSLHSMILWGPPGTGKTTLAYLLAKASGAVLESISAVLHGIKEIRLALDQARARQQQGKLTILFVDEAHRFNKSQQDAFLPHIESGLITFIGATTENPSFEINNALLSRASVYQLKPLADKELQLLIDRALAVLKLEMNGSELIIDASQGDARKCLNYLEVAANIALSQQKRTIEREVIEKVLTSSYRLLDKGGDRFHEQISALHKSIRGSAPDAAIFWCQSMLAGGCSPHYLLRRLVRVASEDVGNADPRALQIALNAWDAFDKLGTPEGELAIVQAVLYLACAPKSNAVYVAYKACLHDIKRYPNPEVPLPLKNAPTQLMKTLNYGQAYRYPHDYPNAYVAGENYLPQGIKGDYYRPVERGLEKKIKEKLAYLAQLATKGDEP